MDLRTFKDRKKGSQIAYQQNEIHKSQKILGPKSQIRIIRKVR